MNRNSTHTRREFFLSGTIAGGGLLLAGFPENILAQNKPADQPQKENEKEEEVSPAEDLMREHGVLERILLIYEEAIRRLRNNRDMDFDALTAAIKIIRAFIEDYHEKLEEDHVFPRFEQRGELAGLVKLLREQHQAGRRLTREFLQTAASAKSLDQPGREKFATALRQFIRMYRPHYAREDTVLFPALHSIMSPKDYDAMGDQFEDQEHKLFGQDGFENMVEQVAGIEKTLGIYELSKFTPKA
jgi:hemerythrin-like domain-containing protein